MEKWNEIIVEAMITWAKNDPEWRRFLMTMLI